MLSSQLSKSGSMPPHVISLPSSSFSSLQAFYRSLYHFLDPLSQALFSSQPSHSASLEFSCGCVCICCVFLSFSTFGPNSTFSLLILSPSLVSSALPLSFLFPSLRKPSHKLFQLTIFALLKRYRVILGHQSSLPAHIHTQGVKQ